MKLYTSALKTRKTNIATADIDLIEKVLRALVTKNQMKGLR